MSVLELRTTAMAAGGEAIAREESGRVVFVADAAPNETVQAALTDERKSFARALTLRVVEPSPDRVEPPCPHVAEGCGGCDWQHLNVAAQRRLRVEQVSEALSRQGGVPDPAVGRGPELAAERLRTTVRGTTGPDGRFAYRRRRSHDVVPVDSCLIAHPLVEEIIRESTFGEATDVTIRVGARTGERMVVVSPSSRDVHVPDGVRVVGADELAAGRRAWVHEQAAGRRWRISGESFFQASPEGAEALVAAVSGYVEELAPDADRMADLCSGVGLFSGTVGAARSVVAVERSRAAVADARHNLVDLDVGQVRTALERWRPSPADLVVADPARRGLGKAGVDAVAASGAALCVLVSCDAASLGRDAHLLRGRGYHHVASTVLDLFGHTSHIEVVTAFSLTPFPGALPS